MSAQTPQETMALGNKTRLEILGALAGGEELSEAEIREALPGSTADGAFNYHVDVLEKAGLVGSRRGWGRRRHFKLTEPH